MKKSTIKELQTEVQREVTMAMGYAVTAFESLQAVISIFDEATGLQGDILNRARKKADKHVISMKVDKMKNELQTFKDLESKLRDTYRYIKYEK